MEWVIYWLRFGTRSVRTWKMPGPLPWSQRWTMPRPSTASVSSIACEPLRGKERARRPSSCWRHSFPIGRCQSGSRTSGRLPCRSMAGSRKDRSLVYSSSTYRRMTWRMRTMMGGSFCKRRTKTHQIARSQAGHQELAHPRRRGQGRRGAVTPWPKIMWPARSIGLPSMTRVLRGPGTGDGMGVFFLGRRLQ